MGEILHAGIFRGRNFLNGEGGFPGSFPLFSNKSMLRRIFQAELSAKNLSGVLFKQNGIVLGGIIFNQDGIA